MLSPYCQLPHAFSLSMDCSLIYKLASHKCRRTTKAYTLCRFLHCSVKQPYLKAARRNLNHVKLLVRLVCTDIWRASASVCSTPSLHGRSSHQIKHLNNYCLICCCGRGACGLIRSRTERETDVGTARFSLLIVRPPGPQVTLTILETLQTRT